MRRFSVTAFVVAVAVVGQVTAPIVPGSRVRLTAPSLGLSEAVGTVQEATDEALLVQFEYPARTETVDRSEIAAMDVSTQGQRKVLKSVGVGFLVGDPLSANVRETRSTQRIRVGRRQRKRTCWDCEREWKRMVVPLEPGRPSEARQLLRTRR